MTHSKIKPKKVKGCACYGSNNIHECFCTPVHQSKKVAETLEEVKCEHKYEDTLDTDEWSSCHCTKYGHGKIVNY